MAASVPSGEMRTPVTLPPGRERLRAKPICTGSKLPQITMGMVEVACIAARTADAVTATITSTRDATSERGELRQARDVVVGIARSR